MHTAAHTGQDERLACRAWRERLLANAGFAPRLARRAAAEPRFDVHALIELRERGCPPELAIRILAPLDLEPRRARPGG